MSQAAAEEFVRSSVDAIAARGKFVVALSGGSTPKRLYALLAGSPIREQVDWPRVEFFWGDERSVPPDDHDSNYRMAKEVLLNSLSLRPDQVHRLEAERQDRMAAAHEYQEAIARVLGVAADGSPPAFDLILLGMGPCGHTASLFPETTALDETSRWVVVNFVPKFNTDRVTLTAPIINRARKIAFLVAGADKAEMLAQVLEGPPVPKRLPSQMIKPAEGEVLWIVDRAAAAQLKQAKG